MAACPIDLNGSWLFPVPGTDVQLHITIFRFASANDGKPGQWLWYGPSEGVGGPTLAWVFEAAKSKLDKRYSEISNPFWLLLYTPYSRYDMEQQVAIREKLAVTKHHFECIFYHDGLCINQIYPYDDSAENTPGKPGWTFHADGAIPLPDDSRYADIS